MTTAPRNQKTPYIVIGVIAIGAIVFGLFAITIGAGVFLQFILVVAAVLLFGGAIYKIYAATYLQVAAMNYKREDLHLAHEREMCRLKAQYAPAPQLAAPKSNSVDDKFTDPARAIALQLLSATIESTDKRYGPKGTQIMTQADANAIGIIPNDWSSAVTYLCSNYDVLAIDGKGTFTTKNKTVGRVLADTAVMSLPGVTR